MPLSSASRFNAEVLRIVAALYETHPRQVALDIRGIFEAAKEAPWNDDDKARAINTAQWLSRSGVLSGDTDAPNFFLRNAQLSASTWQLLQRNFADCVVQPLGRAVVHAAQVGGHELEVTGELLVRLLGGG